MTITDTKVFVTEHGDGSADFTLSVGGEDHKFSAAVGDDNTAVLSYEETLSWRGEIRVSEPRNEIFKRLMQSDEMTNYLESNNLTEIRRQRHD